MFLCSVHLGRFSDHYDFLMSICITLQNSKSVQNDLVFKTVRFIFDLTIFFVAESLLFWRLQTSYSRVYNPKEICYKKHITVLTDDFAWIPSIESTSKSLSSECLMCHVFRIIRRGNWSPRLSEFNRQCSFFHIIVFWKLATFSWHILLNQSAFLNHFFMTLTFSFAYNFFFSILYSQATSAFNLQVLASHGFGFQRTFLMLFFQTRNNYFSGPFCLWSHEPYGLARPWDITFSNAHILQ